MSPILAFYSRSVHRACSSHSAHWAWIYISCVSWMLSKFTYTLCTWHAIHVIRTLPREYWKCTTHTTKSEVNYWQKYWVILKEKPENLINTENFYRFCIKSNRCNCADSGMCIIVKIVLVFSRQTAENRI